MSDTKIIIGATGVFTELDNAISKMEHLDKTYESTRKAGKEVFTEANKAANSFGTGIDQLDAKLRAQSAAYTKISAAVNKLNSETGKFAQIQAGFKGDQLKFGETAKNTDAARVSLQNYIKQSEKLKEVNGGISSGSALFGKLALGIAGGGVALLGFINKAKEAQAEAEKLRTTLNVAFKGDELKTSGVFQQLTAFAEKTPFTFNEITTSFTKLVNRGFEPTIDQLTQIGDLASSQGKSFDQLAEAILDAQSGEFERLKEFGIKAKVAGDQVVLSFKGQTIAVKNTEDAVRSAILGFGKLQGVAGSLEAQSKTLEGIESNLGDSFEKLFRNIGAGTNVVIKPLQEGLAKVVSNLADLANVEDKASDQARALQAEFNAQVEILKIGNFTQKERSDIITELNSKYGAYGFNLNAETASLNDIAEAQAKVNEEFTKRVILLAYQEDLTALAKKGAEAAKTALEAQKAINQIAVDNKAIIDKTGAPTVNIGGLNKGGLDIENDVIAVRTKSLDQAKAYQEQQNELTKATNDLFESMGTSLSAMLKTAEGHKTAGNAAAGNSKAVDDLTKKYEALRKSLSDQANDAKLSIADPEARLALERDFQLTKIDEIEKGVKSAAKALGKEVDITSDIALLKKAVEVKYQADLAVIREKAAKDAAEAEAKAQAAAERQAAIKAGLDQTLGRDGLPQDNLFGDLEAQSVILGQEINNNLSLEPAAEAAKKTFTEAFKSIGEKLKDAFGLDDGAISVIEDRFSQISAAFDQLAQNGVDSANAIIDSTQEKVSAAQDALDKEIDIAKLGFSSNVDLRRQELESQQAALKKAEDQKRKAVKAQIALDSVEQGSSLLTASANILSTTSAIAPPFGTILAALTIGAMFAAFIDSKAKALKAASLGDGGQGRITDDGVIIGSSHRDGGVPLEVEGGEFFTHDGKKFAAVNKRMTAKHFALLRAVNNDDRIEMAKALTRIVSETPTFNHAAGDDVIRMQDNLAVMMNDGHGKATNEKLDKVVSKFDAVLAKMGGGERRSETSTHIIIQKGNKTTKIRK